MEIMEEQNENPATHPHNIKAIKQLTSDIPQTQHLNPHNVKKYQKLEKTHKKVNISKESYMTEVNLWHSNVNIHHESVKTHIRNFKYIEK